MRLVDERVMYVEFRIKTKNNIQIWGKGLLAQTPDGHA